MTQPKIWTAGKYQYFWSELDAITDFADTDFPGRTLEMDFAQQILAAGGLLYPVIGTRIDNRDFLIDGRRRVLHCRWLASQAPSFLKEKFKNVPGIGEIDPKMFQKVQAKMFLNINPTDQKTWGLILNEERSDNLIFAWQTVKALQTEGNWDAIAELYRLNKARFIHFETLDKLSEPDVWVEAFHTGKITEANLLSVAKLGKRQEIVKKTLITKGKVVGSDIAAAKLVSNQQATASRTFSMAIPAPVTPAKQIFLVLDPSTEPLNPNAIGTDFGAMVTVKNQFGNGHKLYRLVEVG